MTNLKGNLMKQHKLVTSLIVAPLIVFLLSSCGSTGAQSSGSIVTQSSANTGTLSVGMAAASTDQYQAVYVTIKAVQANQSTDDAESGWQTVGTPNQTYDLLQLVNGTRESLGITVLGAGHYAQMRLILADTPNDSINILSRAHPFANYAIDLEGNEHELKVPSGMQSGLKIVQGFDINENSTTELVLDFDASASVVIAGHSGKYLLKPTIKMLETSLAGIINGSITKYWNDSLLANVAVSAQIFDVTASDAKDRVKIQTSTIADADGLFSLFLAPGTYNLVFIKQGYQAFVIPVTVVAGEIVTVNASLADATTGTISGAVDMSGGDSETYATLSFRQSVVINGNNEEIELLSLNVADGGNYYAILPANDVTVVSSSSGNTTQSVTATINAGLDTSLNSSL